LLIEEYFLRLEQALASCPQIEQMTLTKERRASYIGFVKGEIVFAGGVRLFLMEFVQTESRVVKTKYRYHCQDASGNPLFRYDNAPHHQTDTFPHHKHIFRLSAGEMVTAAHLPSIETVLNEVVRLMEKE
jgi:Family of unknown function (DUF6516)